MSATAALAAILGALLIGAASPGPSFVLVTSIAINQSRIHGLAAAIGMGIGGAAFAVLALLGLAALLTHVEWLYFVLKIFGGAYLVWLGIRIWRGAEESMPTTNELYDPPSSSLLRPLGLALATQLSNPKTAVVYGSIFAAMLPASSPYWLLVALPLLVFLVEAGWYGVVAFALSAKHPRAMYVRYKGLCDRTAGSVMGLLGVRLISSTLGSADR